MAIIAIFYLIKISFMRIILRIQIKIVLLLESKSKLQKNYKKIPLNNEITKITKIAQITRIYSSNRLWPTRAIIFRANKQKITTRA